MPSYVNIAKETLEILERGSYKPPSNKTVILATEQSQAEEGTVLYSPKNLDLLLDRSSNSSHELSITVTDESTQKAAQRLVQVEGCTDLVLLNFASARNPGGGFLRGSKAQEEDLSRCSGLYPCLLKQPKYYEINRALRSTLYTDNIIYSPKVPFFRVVNQDLLEEPFTASIITAPAPNTEATLRQDPTARVTRTLRRRAGNILAVARDQGHTSLLLGAWGCGIFRNDPDQVAGSFKYWLEGPFRGSFGKVTFAILDRVLGQPTFKTFKTILV
jgi:uncharacterized protein (TIGR02452 family)